MPFVVVLPLLTTSTVVRWLSPLAWLIAVYGVFKAQTLLARHRRRETRLG
jgi:cytochrome c-type biogenesis protein CcmH/NrfF